MRILGPCPRTSWLLLCGALAFAFAATPWAARAQDVFVSGKLHIGFGDQDNATGVRQISAVPVCAGGGPLLNPGTVGTTRGTLLVNARADAVPGVGGTITFDAVGGLTGGAQQKSTATCRTTITPGANPQVRSRTRIGSANFPGRKGAFTSMLTQAPVPATPTATYRLSAGGGLGGAITRSTWTTMATPSAPANAFTGQAFERTPPNFLGTPGGFPMPLSAVHRFQPGPARFGGGLPYSGTSAVQLGIQFTTGPIIGVPTYGVRLYANGFIPVGPLLIGTNVERGTHDLSPSNFSPFVYPDGLVFARQNGTFAARTPGGTTIDQQGAIRTLGGGNTQTPAPGFTTSALPIVSPVAFQGFFHGWTTGGVTHTNRVGPFTTIRKAQGFDVAVTSGSALAGETRRLQVVSPWSAAVRPQGVFGLPVPRITHGGVAVLTLNVIPAPEPGFVGGLSVVLGVLAGVTRKRAPALRD